MSIDIQNVYAIDFETTGVDPKTCEPLEVAIYSSLNYSMSQLIKPSGAIPAETSAIHHIVAEDVEFEASWSDVRAFIQQELLKRSNGVVPVLVAHNADYEKAIISRGDIPFIPVQWICTYKCALRVWPDAPSHKNEVLRYWLKLGSNRGRKIIQTPHSALHDAIVTYLLFTELSGRATLEQLIEWTEEPANIPRVPMGKHFGQKWEEVPAPYLDWCVKQIDMRDDVKHAAKKELARRRTNAAS